ncbi:hypothetical protein SAMN05421779_101466 [Insolitispirillum peregrinum]|uniref:Uncharacterized protein n=1 Tax=Insolitispirillum peregrinum TaxID=80876 RepID=A0A1N7IQ20_9PROT|nr:hypothetical protein SAMN05421779_101466 [Insolitispirillum peregrinum]
MDTVHGLLAITRQGNRDTSAFFQPPTRFAHGRL